MSRSIALVSMILAMSVTTRNAEAIRYIVEPVALSDGYAITGGFIETDASGPLMEGDITDYQVTVEGDLPFTFLPSNQGSSIVISTSVSSSVLARDGEIFIPELPEPIEFASLAFCSGGCTVKLEYFRRWGFFIPPRRNIVYHNFNTVVEAFTDDEKPGPIVIAEVPEPSTVTLIFLGVCVFATRMQRKA